MLCRQRIGFCRIHNIRRKHEINGVDIEWMVQKYCASYLVTSLFYMDEAIVQKILYLGSVNYYIQIKALMHAWCF